MKRKKPRPGRSPHPAPPQSADPAPAAAAATDVNASGILEQARQLISQGRQDEALSMLTRLAQAPRPAAEALGALGRLRMDRQEFAEAASVFRRMIQQSPEDAPLRNSLAMALVMAGRREEALPELEEAARLAPQEAVFQLNLGKYHILMENFARGRQVLQKLLPQAPAGLRDQTLGYLNQCLAQLGLPLATAAPESPAAPLVSPAPAPGAGAAPAPGDSPAPAPAPAPEMDMLLCCGKGLDSFVGGLIAGLAPWVRVEKLVSEQGQDFLEAIARHQTVWIEWGNELAEFLTKQGAQALKGKRVILRIHAYEVMQALADRIDFRQITDLMFVCAGMRDLLLERRPEIRQQVERIHVIPNGIDTARFQLTPRAPGLEIAYVGYLNFKKGPMELMYALEALRRRDGRCRLHVAGVFQDLYSETACRHFLAQNHLEEAVRFHGWVQDVPAWLADKNAIICTSLSESQGLGLMEAMAMGVKPLIYNFHTAEHIYPRQWLWNNLDELAQMLHQAHDPQEVRRFVEENYSLDLQVGRLLRMLQGREEVVFAGPIFAETPLPPVPKECLAENLESRALANKDFGLRLLGERRFNEGITFLERAAAQSRYRDESCLLQLQKGYLETGRLTEAAGAWRTRGMQAALSGDYQTMLLCFAEFYYFMYKLTGSYKYQGFDQAIDTVLGLVAEKITPVPGPAKQLEGIDPKKIKVAMVLDSLDVGWATVKRFVELGKNLNKDLFEVVYLSVMEPQPSWDKAMADLTREGCRLVHYSGHEWLPKIKMMLHSLRSIDCDFLLLNTPYVTPYYHLLALCRPARKTIKFVSQGGGRESGVDIAWSSMDGLLIDEVQEAKYIGPAYVIPASKKWRARPRRPGELKAVAVGRPTKFMNNHGYWRAMRLALEAIPNLGIDFIGVEAKEVRHVTGRLPSRARFLGFQTNVVDLLPQYDVLVDTWPGGGGSTIREASAVGVPVISVRADLYEHYDARAKLHVGCNEFVHPELLLPTPDAARLVEVLRRLADDPDYHRRVAQEAAQIPVLSPERAIRELEAFLLATATTWRGPRLS